MSSSAMSEHAAWVERKTWSVCLHYRGVRQQERTELMVDVRLHEGSSIQATEAMIQSVEQRISPLLTADGENEPLIQHFTSYVGAGSARFFLALNPDLPNPSFGKIVIQTTSVYAREELRQPLLQRRKLLPLILGARGWRHHAVTEC